ncbi:MAG: ATP-dependent DNA helicase [Nitrososphaerota archaeon]|nr:ATP-dependent DNA helicase [Candidatus Bathyarchaeota archaeon]MDW8194014.1 ATP-dependent DNA helicase [Nitrososphaerota archaeon]
MEAVYICRRCGKAYNSDTYLKSRFCEKCGTLLVVASAQSAINMGAAMGEGDFEGLVREFFPYASFRPFQLKAIKFAYGTLRDGKIGLLCSPCGTGKSISVLTAFFAARDHNPAIGRLIALTRTKNQLEIYSRELKNIKDHSSASFVAAIFKSKKEMCPHVLENSRLRDVTYRDFLYYCKGLKEGLFGDACEYYLKTYNGWKPSWQAYNLIRRVKDIGPILPEETYELCRDEGLCPYEVTKVLTRHADIVIGNYNYILVDAIRGSILGKAGIRTNAINCVFDEAHSLPYYASGIFSHELSSISVRRAYREVRSFDIDDMGFLEALYRVMVDFGKKAYRNYGVDVEHIFDGNALTEALAKKLRATGEALVEILHKLADCGEQIRVKRSEIGKTPISYLSRCVDFLIDWVSLTGSSYVRYVKVEGGRRKIVRLGIRCLDPSLASSIINELRSAILMSGTLWNMDYYMDVLGLNRGRCQSLELPSPFPRENRLILVDGAVTTKFEKRGELQWKRIASHLGQIIQTVDGRVAVYFPSYEVMWEIAQKVKIEVPLFVEEKRTRISDVLRFLQGNGKCVVFGVARGKISEGVDMTLDGRSLLSAVVIVGLPFPKKTELQTALYKYFREKFGVKAVEYANDMPCLNALAQSAGRLLRSPEDKGIIVIMDRRAAGRFKRKLPEEWRNEMKIHMRIEKTLETIRQFINPGIC